MAADTSILFPNGIPSVSLGGQTALLEGAGVPQIKTKKAAALSQEALDALAQAELGRPTLMISPSLVASNIKPPAMPEPLPPYSFGEIPFTTDLAGPAGQYSAAHAARVKQYQDELESAERLKRQQAIESGMVPAKSDQIKRQLMKSGDDIWQVDPFTGAASMVVKGEPRATKKEFIKSGENVWEVDPFTGESMLRIPAPEKIRALPFGMFTESEREKMPPGKNERDVFQGVFNGENVYKRTALSDYQALLGDEEGSANQPIAGTGATNAPIAEYGSTNTAAAIMPTRTPSPQAIAALKAMPGLADEFDRKYGQGSAAKYLAQQ